MHNRVLRIRPIIRLPAPINETSHLLARLETGRRACFGHLADELLAEDGGRVGVVFGLEDVEFGREGRVACAAA